jgi:hypothetical protein
VLSAQSVRKLAGVVTVVDVKPAAKMADPAVMALFAWTRELVEWRGWGFEAWSGADPRLLDCHRVVGPALRCLSPLQLPHLARARWEWIGGRPPGEPPVPRLLSGSTYERSLRTLRRGATMDILWWILIFLAVMVWIAIAFWPARVAGRKGHSFLGYFVFSLFFFPAALLAAYLVHDRTQVPPTPAAVH